MDLELNYPYGIPFFSNIDMIFFTIINNSHDIIYIYLKKDKKNNLANIIFPFTKKKFYFPDKSIIFIYLDIDFKKFICRIKIKNGWTYIYP